LDEIEGRASIKTLGCELSGEVENALDASALAQPLVIFRATKQALGLVKPPLTLVEQCEAMTRASGSGIV
jgi:hypothetical protein